jgi:hypothetical protein
MGDGRCSEAMHEKFTLRLETGLRKMQAAAETGRLKEETLAGERLGRLKQQNWRASHAFDVTIKKLKSPRGKQQLEITWQKNAKFGDWAELADGCYLLRSNLTDVDAATLWQRYIQLTEAEWAFRITKDELEIRPIWHQKEDRVRAHIQVCFLAYALWKTLAGWMNRAGLGDAPRTLLHVVVSFVAATILGVVVVIAMNRQVLSKYRPLLLTLYLLNGKIFSIFLASAARLPSGSHGPQRGTRASVGPDCSSTNWLTMAAKLSLSLRRCPMQ